MIFLIVVANGYVLVGAPNHDFCFSLICIHSVCKIMIETFAMIITLLFVDTDITPYSKQ